MWILAALAPAVPLAHEDAGRSFGYWVSLCDNGLRCQVTTVLGSPANMDVRIQLRREAGSASPVEVSVDAKSGSGPHSLIMNGRAFRLVRRDGDLVVEPGAGFDVARAMAATRSIKVFAGGKTYPVPALGSAAALRHMDARQRRAGTTTAIVARGPKPASSVPPAPALPIRTEKRPGRNKLVICPSAERLAAWARAEECVEKPSPFYAPQSWPIDERSAVILVMCHPGGRNPHVLVKVGTKADGSDARPAIFDFNASLSEGPDPRPPEHPSRDEKSGRLTSGQNGGLVYTSTSEEWVWDGRRFRLVNGSTSYGSTFRARVRRR